MNPQKHINENEQLEIEEQSIGEPMNTVIIGVDFSSDFYKLSKITITPEEDEQLTLEKRQAEADDRENDLNDNYARGIGEII